MDKGKLSILGCGWLGKAVGTYFVKEGWRVLGSTTTPERIPTIDALGIKPVLIKLDPIPTGDGLDPFFDADVLLISIPPKRKAGLTEMYLKQIESLAAFISTKRVSRVIFVSSTSVYKEVNRAVVEEDADPSSYLVLAENFFARHSSFSTTILRFGGLVGPDRHPGRFLSGKQNVDGPEAVVNIIHQQDCVKIIATIVRQNLFGHTFNACADDHPSKRTFYEAASRALSLQPPSFNEQSKTSFKIVSSRKLKEMADYAFIFPDPLGML
jgi:nucleoside-diphosphate-sugar epimerase